MKEYHNFKLKINYKVLKHFSLQLKVAKPNGDPLNPARLNKIRIKIKTSYSWDNSKDLEETVTPSSDGFIIVSRNVPSSANHVSLEVSFISLY